MEHIVNFFFPGIAISFIFLLFLEYYFLLDLIPRGNGQKNRKKNRRRKKKQLGWMTLRSPCFSLFFLRSGFTLVGTPCTVSPKKKLCQKTFSLGNNAHTLSLSHTHGESHAYVGSPSFHFSRHSYEKKWNLPLSRLTKQTCAYAAAEI